MKTYIEHSKDIYFEGLWIPKNPANSDYARILEELKNGQAELVPYETPAPTWEQIKAQRDQLLIQSDWTTLSDATPKPNKEAWLTYRQTLRDITTTYPSPEAVIWPTNPLGMSYSQPNTTEIKFEQEPTLQAVLNKLEQDKIKAEQEKIRLEEERIKQEEQLQRQKEERLKQEELQKQKELEEQERLRQEKLQRQEEERQRQEAEQQRQREEEQKKQEELQRLEDEKNKILEELQQIDQQLNT